MRDHEANEAKRRGMPDRRRLILGGTALAVASAFASQKLLAKIQTEAAAPDPARAEELVVAFDGAAVSRFVLDPHNSAYAPHNRVIRSIFDSLTLLLPDQSVGPWLAESWEISSDRKVYDFKLRRGVRFHDGTPFDAKAVKANFDRLGDPRSLLTSRRNLGPYQDSTVLAEDKVRLRLKEPYTPLLRNLSMTRVAMVSPSAVARYGKAFGQHPVGTGPFRFVSMSTGTEIRLERNPEYQWGPSTANHHGPPLVERIIFKNVPEQATRVAVLLSGQAHVADYIPPQDLADIKHNPQFGLFEQELLNTNYSLSLNVEKKPWDDEQVRLAFRLALDLDKIVSVIYRGTLKRAWSPLSPGIYGSIEDELADSWSPDPVRADEILTRKGWLRGPDGIRLKDGNRLVVKFLETQGNREKRLDVIQLIRRQLWAVGIDLKMASVTPGAQAATIRANRFDLSGSAQFAPDPDVLSTYYADGRRNAVSATRIKDPELSDWLEMAARTDDGEERRALYRKAQRRIVDKTYGVPIYVLLYNIAASKRVSGLQVDTHGFPIFYGVQLNA